MGRSETLRSTDAAAAMTRMMAQEVPAEPVDLVDILSDGEEDAVAFTALWRTDA